MKLEVLVSPYIDKVYVTRQNQMYWNESMSFEEKLYVTSREVKENYLTNKKLDSRLMFTLRKPGTRIKLNKYLDSLLLDKPRDIIPVLGGGSSEIGVYAEKALRESLEENGLGHIPINSRKCSVLCTCRRTYSVFNVTNKNEMRKRFAVKP